MNRQLAKTLKNMANGMVIVAVALAFLISGIRILGFEVFGVLTGSMEPTYPIGSLIYVKSADPDELRVNDVITFSLTPGVIATHRIVEVVPDADNPSIVRFRTKGDANASVDASLVSGGNIVGKVMFCVPHLGHLASYIQQPPGLYVAILVSGVMIAFIFYTDSLDTGRKAGTKKRAKKKRFDPASIVNPISMRLLGKPLMRRKRARRQPREDSSFYSGYRPPRTSEPVQRRPAAPEQTQRSYAQPYTPDPQQRGYAQPYAPDPQQRGYAQPYAPDPQQRGYAQPYAPNPQRRGYAQPPTAYYDPRQNGPYQQPYQPNAQAYQQPAHYGQPYDPYGRQPGGREGARRGYAPNAQHQPDQQADADRR